VDGSNARCRGVAGFLPGHLKARDAGTPARDNLKSLRKRHIQRMDPVPPENVDGASEWRGDRGHKDRVATVLEFFNYEGRDARASSISASAGFQALSRLSPAMLGQASHDPVPGNARKEATLDLVLHHPPGASAGGWNRLGTAGEHITPARRQDRYYRWPPWLGRSQPPAVAALSRRRA
jgi:hypothetical protein